MTEKESTKKCRWKISININIDKIVTISNCRFFCVGVFIGPSSRVNCFCSSISVTAFSLINSVAFFSVSVLFFRVTFQAKNLDKFLQQNILTCSLIQQNLSVFHSHYVTVIFSGSFSINVVSSIYSIIPSAFWCNTSMLLFWKSKSAITFVGLE